MRRKLFGMFLLLALVVWIPFHAASAQGTTPGDQATIFLAKQGYAVLAVDNYPDQNGNPLPNIIYVLMNANSSNLDSQVMALQVAWGFAAIRKFYPNATTLITALRDQQFLLLFVTDSNTFDQFLSQQLPSQDFWRNVRGNVRIYDTTKNAVVTEKDFTGGSQTDKSFTTANFTPQNPNCSAGPNEAQLLVQNNYIGKTLHLTIGGGAWGMHDYDVPGDAQRYILHMPPGAYTYTAVIPNTGIAQGQLFQYNGGNCYPLTFSP